MELPIHTKFNMHACMLTLNVIDENYLDPSTGSGTSHIGRIDMLGSRNLVFKFVYSLSYSLSTYIALQVCDTFHIDPIGI